MLVLFEAPGGYAIFKVLKDKKLKSPENIYKEFSSPAKVNKFLKLKHFAKFPDMEEAMSSSSSLLQGKLSKMLKKTIKKHVLDEAQEELAVTDAKLGNLISSKYNVNCISNTAIIELNRKIRLHLDSLLEGISAKELSAMSLGVAHGLARYRFKFSPDKIDKMIIEAVNALDDLDKEINNYVMKCKEWYGWHFPELIHLVSDNYTYIKTVVALGLREEAEDKDLSEILPEDKERAVKDMAAISMGVDVEKDDIVHIVNLCNEVLEMQKCRTKLADYLKNRMLQIAPNIVPLVGEMVGARLIAHAGSLMNLAKYPASTIQILGAEKALFRALKAHHDTPKYGLIYHATLIGQVKPAVKGKVSRMLSSKVALAARADAFDEDNAIEIGIEHRAKLERRLKALEQGHSKRISGTGKARAKQERYENKSQVFQYKAADDTLLTPQVPQKRKRKSNSEDEEPNSKRKFERQSEGGEPSFKRKRKEESELVEKHVKVKDEDSSE